MLTSTFCHLPGVTVAAERRLWERGAVTWGDLRAKAGLVLSARKIQAVRRAVQRCTRAWAAGDLGYFASRLPLRELPHLLPHLGGQLAYLDIETTGLSRGDLVTTATLYDGGRARLYVRDINLHCLKDDLLAKETLVTYNGRRFDLPFLQRDLGISWSGFHIDLYGVLRDRGLRGGLKACEKALRVARASSADSNGAAAVDLWRRYRGGDRSALRTLLLYNMEDTLALERILVRTYNDSMKPCPVFRPAPMPNQAEAGRLAQVRIRQLCSLKTDAQDVVS